MRNKIIWMLGGFWPLLSGATTCQQDWDLLNRNFQLTNKAFSAFFEAVQKSPKRILDYANTVGTATDSSDRFQPTIYSQFSHLYRSVRAFQKAPKTPLTKDILDAMIHALGATDTDHSPSFISTLKSMTSLIVNEAKNKGELQFLLGLSPTPKGHSTKSLVDCLKAVQAPLFSQWQSIATYSEDKNDTQNLFSLAHQIAACAEDTAMQERVRELIGNIGTPLEDNPKTLFGRVIATQKLLNAVEREGLPVPFARLHHLLWSTRCSLSQSLRESLSYIRGETNIKPRHTPKNRFSALHNLCRKTMISSLVPAQGLWPEKDEPETLQQKLQTLATRVNNLQLLFADKEVLTLKELIGLKSKNTYARDSAMDAVMTLARTLADRNLLFDDESYVEWRSFLGYPGSTNPKTLWGVLEKISRKLEKPTSSTWNEVLQQLGTPSDFFAAQEQKATFYGVLNLLFSKCWHGAPFPKRQLVAQAQRIEQREDLPAHLKKLIEKDPTHSLSGQIQRLLTEFHDLAEHHSFLGLDQVLATLCTKMPILERALNHMLQQPSSELFAVLGQAWWQEKGVFGAVNTMLSAIRGEETKRLFSSPPSPLKKETLQPRTFEWYLAEISALGQKNSNLLAKIGKTQENAGVSHNSSRRRLQTLADHFHYLSEILAFVSWMEEGQIPRHKDPAKIVLLNEKTKGLLAQLHSLAQDIGVISRKADAKASERIQKALDENDPTSLFGQIRDVSSQGIASFFELIMDPYRCYEWNLTGQNSLRQDVTELQDFFQQNSDIAALKALRLLGEASHNARSPSVFGKLAAVEKMLLDFWNRKYPIPLSEIGQIAADFWGKVQEIIHEDHANRALRKIGKTTSPAGEDSLFGLLNAVIHQCLASPLESQLRAASSQLKTATMRIQSHSALEDDTRDTILATLAGEKGSSEKPALMDLITLASRATEMAGGTFNLRQAEQLWTLGGALEVTLQKLTRKLTETAETFDPFFPIMNQELATSLVTAVGTPQDLTAITTLARLQALADGATSASFPASLPALEKDLTLFGLVHRLLIRLHSACRQRCSWPQSEEAEVCWRELETIKQRFFPGSCSFYDLTEGTYHIAEAFSRSAAWLESIAKDTTMTVHSREKTPEDFETFCQQKGSLALAVEQSLVALQSAFNKLAQALPQVLEAGAGKATNISELFFDGVCRAMDVAQTVENWVSFLGYTAPSESPQSLPETWNCVAFSQTVERISQELKRLAKATVSCGDQVDKFLPYVPDLVETGTGIKNGALALRQLRLPLEDISATLRRQALSQGVLYCSQCQTKMVAQTSFKVVSACVEVEEAMNYASHQFLTQAKIRPLRVMHESLKQAVTPSQGHSLLMDLASPKIDESGRAETTQDGKPVWAEGSLPATLQDLKQHLEQIMKITKPLYKPHTPQQLAEMSNAKFTNSGTTQTD